MDVYVKQGVRKQLSEKFNCSALTIRRALTGKTNTQLAQAIRASAINDFGGRTERVQRVIVKSN